MRIARIERDGQVQGGDDVDVAGYLAIITAESFRHFEERARESEDPSRDLTLETVWLR